MKNVNSQRIRSLLVRGAKALTLSSVLLAVASCSHGKTDTDNNSSRAEVTTSCTTLMTTSTDATSTTSSTTTSTSMTTTAATTTQTTTEMIVWENTVQTETETEQLYVEPQTEYYEAPMSADLPITERERVLLCNIVANEYGSDWVSVYDKACVVATVMNRVNSDQFPNDIESVLTQPYQFSGYWASDSYYSTVTDSCIEAVDYYFEHPYDFGSYLYFEGDGSRNYFH